MYAGLSRPMGSSLQATKLAAREGATSQGVALDDICIRIFEADFDYVYRSLVRMGISAADAEDLAQEVFLVMWRRRADWDSERQYARDG